ncbi:MAG TPA: hypothetical protein VFY61_15615, partial [Pyrinomonadaceae bacterium]|nr:hypothetical protein [Pyrinomonadaceae bacterium]
MRTFPIQIDPAMFAISEYRPDKIGQNIARPDFNKRPNAAFIHRLDLIHEANRLGNLRGQIFTDCLRILWVNCCVRGTINVDVGTY